MPRPVPAPPDSWKPPEQDTATYHIKVVTPLFGGGHIPREVDPLDCIRPPSIRGHLRFWWRATAGAAHATPEDLFKAEEAIWGSVDKPSQVNVRVSISREGNRVACGEPITNPGTGRQKPVPKFQTGWPAYALHPFQGKITLTGTDAPAEAFVGVEFDLTLEGPMATSPAVKTAIYAWVLYGGLGARTRRGCGSLASPDIRRVDIEEFSTTKTPRISALRGARYVIGSPGDSAIEAWRKAVEVYRDFRQGVPNARQSGTNQRPAGRSHWPEPDAIRRITGAVDHPIIHPLEGAYPRADLGLPIVFHFIGDGAPPDTTLDGPKDGKRRMGSPVITKAISDGNKFWPLVMVLNAPHAWYWGALRLQSSQSPPAAIPRTRIDLDAVERAVVKPLHDQGDEPIREALLRFVAGKWRSEVQEVAP